MTTVHLVHGVNVTDRGRRTTGRLAPWFHLVGFETRQHTYPWVGLLGVRAANPRVAGRLVKAVKPGDIGCGHSNGCAILADAADRGAPFEGLVLINPALESAREIAQHVQWIHVYHNKGDLPVVASEILDWLPWYKLRRKEHFMGDMGNRGYTGPSPRYRNFDCDAAATQLDIESHSEVFGQLNAWGQVIAGHTYAAKAWARTERAAAARAEAA